MRGYQDDDGRIVPLEGAYYRTGDVATRDAEGYITYVGRADDVFKSNDYRLSPFELESALIEHPAVPRPRSCPRPTRRASRRQGLCRAGRGPRADRETALSIFSFLRDRLAPYKRIRRIEFSDLPKTISGKIRRVELRDARGRLADRRARAARVPDGGFRRIGLTPQLNQKA